MRNLFHSLFPRTILGKASLGLVIAMPVLFFLGAWFVTLLYPSTPAGNTIAEDLLARPALALTMLAGMLAGILAFLLGLLAVFKRKERSLLVYLSTLIGGGLIYFLIAEWLTPH